MSREFFFDVGVLVGGGGVRKEGRKMRRKGEGFWLTCVLGGS